MFQAQSNQPRPPAQNESLDPPAGHTRPATLRFAVSPPFPSFAPVNNDWPTVSIIVPTRPEQRDVPAVSACRQLDYPPDRLEILVARGRQPSIQRNAALRRARGELIYFLDDDSLPRTDNLRRAVPQFADPQTWMVGGPNLCPPDAPAREQVFALVLASWLAFGPSRARYCPVGTRRSSSEKELILCNLMARRAVLLDLGGFNEALYPNEENALMDELQRRGGRLVYDPEFMVYRRPRRTLRAFAKMVFTYGRGRAEQFRVNPTPGSAPNFVPPLFVVYLAVALWVGGFTWLPLGAYALALVAQAAALTRLGRPAHAVAAIPLMVLTHIGYGLGFWRGLFTRLRRGPEDIRSEVTLEVVPVVSPQG